MGAAGGHVDLQASRRLKSEAPTKVPARGRPKGRFTQHRRLDKLRLLLEQHPRGLTIYELADLLEVTPRSMRRYLEEVRERFDLVGSRERAGGAQRWRVDPASMPRKVELRRTQAYALLAARRMFEPMRGSALFEEIDFAVQRLVSVARRPGRGPNAGVADARLEDRFLYLPYAPKDYAQKTEELDDLFQAVADLRPLTCTYGAGQGERVEIHPYALVMYRDAIYCVGLHVKKNEVRTFLLDRMKATQTSATTRFSLPEGFKIDDWFQGSFGIFRGGDPIKVVVEFDARVATLVRSRRVHATQKLTAIAGGGVRLTMSVGDLTEVVTWVLGWGETARVIEPQELRDRIVNELSGALGRYR